MAYNKVDIWLQNRLKYLNKDWDHKKEKQCYATFVSNEDGKRYELGLMANRDEGKAFARVSQLIAPIAATGHQPSGKIVWSAVDKNHFVLPPAPVKVAVIAAPIIKLPAPQPGKFVEILPPQAPRK